MRVLIAEDERITRVSLARQLASLGHEVVAAEDGEQAWEAFGKAPFDIVITDWEMPRLSGVELIARIREKPRESYVYIMMLTSRSDKGDIVSGIEAGADDFLSKPFDKEELRVRLLAGERIVQLEQALNAQNVALRDASERMRNDLQAAARVQRAMLPKSAINTPRVRTAWTYVPTDELAGDAVGLELIDDRYLVAYVIDVSGHGVPAALLSVTAMHALSPTSEGASLLRTSTDHDGHGPVQRPSRIVGDLNRRFSTGNNDNRFLTMVLCVLDTHDGVMRFARAGHPLPVVIRAGVHIPVSDEGGPPLGVVDIADFDDVEVRLKPGDRVYLYSDGFPEQPSAADKKQFGDRRLLDYFVSSHTLPGEAAVAGAVDALAAWAGEKRFIDDVSLVAVEWVGA
jgi:sigma-B regulation protein RsbU (phosphoserine phosphatase)